MAPRGNKKKRVRRPRAAATLSIRGYAGHRRSKGLDGGTPAAVQKALQSGRLPSARKDKSGHWKIDPRITDKEWIQNTDPSRLPKGSAGRPIEPGLSLPQARALREEFAAKTEKLKYEKLVGIMIEAGKAERESFLAYRTARDRLLRVADRVEAMVGVEAADQIRTEIREALEEIACVDPEDL